MVKLYGMMTLFSISAERLRKRLALNGLDAGLMALLKRPMCSMRAVFHSQTFNQVKLYLKELNNEKTILRTRIYSHGGNRSRLNRRHIVAAEHIQHFVAGNGVALPVGVMLAPLRIHQPQLLEQMPNPLRRPHLRFGQTEQPLHL